MMDIASLTLPLPPPLAPCGEDLIFSPEFDAIQEARRFDDPSISQGEWVAEIKEADWPGVTRLCQGILANKSKDLRVACWLVEARCKIDGLPGLAETYTLLAALCESFWDDIHPLPEDGDLEQRVGVLDWLANQTPRLLRDIALTRSARGNFSLIDLEAARALAKQIERNPGQAEEITRHASVSLEQFEAAVSDTARTYFADGLRQAEQAKNAIKSVQTLLDSRMGQLSPAFGQAFDVLEDIARFFHRHSGNEKATKSVDAPTESASPSLPFRERIEPNFGECHEIVSGPIGSREQAIRQLQEIAGFFRRTEPHSPVAYLAEKAARWGSMPLHEWLRTVVKDESALLRMEELLGVEPGSETPH
jgi:type VI secretion system protein ImpA